MIAYETYRAPKHHGDALISPEWSEQPALLEQNRATIAHWHLTIAGVDWQTYAYQARAELISSAILYTSRYRDVSRYDDLKAQLHQQSQLLQQSAIEVHSVKGCLPAAPHTRSLPCIVMSGHQPTLFHPGVWFKNFALDRTTRLVQSIHRDAVAVNLVIDNDVATAPSIRLPVIVQDQIRQEAIAFDTASSGVPYEQSRLQDREQFDSFGQQVAQAIKPLVKEPLIECLWPHAQRAVRSCENTSCVIAHARHSLEAELGLDTLELPLSHACRTRSFAMFALMIMSKANPFRQIYNDSLRDYREAHGIRSSAHPVPQLGSHKEWIETPFWIYGDDSPQRRSAWVRICENGDLEISNRVNKSVRITEPLDSHSAAVELADFQASNWKLRPKALVTTMYARLVLSDLFIHGIGGAKYDQLGDRITTEFFGVAPPKMMVVSATVQLPVMQLIPQGRSAKQVRKRLRDVRFAPETFAQEAALAPELLAKKRELLATIPPQGQRLQWHQDLQTVNQQMTDCLDGVKQALEAELLASIRAQSVAQMLRSREYSFCLFDRDRLLNAYRTMLES